VKADADRQSCGVYFASGGSIKQQTNNKQQAKLTPLPDSALKVVGGEVCHRIEPLPGVDSRSSLGERLTADGRRKRKCRSKSDETATTNEDGLQSTFPQMNGSLR
jgi:hypothetical protein